MGSATYSLLARNSQSDARRRRRSLISLTPLIDVVFILLIFFMLASSFSTDQAIQLAMPGAGTTEGALPGSLVRVKRDGLDLNGEPLTLDELYLRVRRLARAPGGALVRFRGLAPPPNRRPAMPRHPLTADDLWSLPRVGSPVPSSHGSLVVPVTTHDLESVIDFHPATQQQRGKDAQCVHQHVRLPGEVAQRLHQCRIDIR